MDILGIGVPELVFIVIIALIVLGPKDMQKTGKTIGTWMRKVVLSPEWREIKDASLKLKRLPNQLMQEANLEEFEQYKRDLGGIIPNNLLEESGQADADSPYGAWSGKGMGMHKKHPTIKKPAPHVDNEPASVKKADSSQETPPVNDSSSIASNNA